MESQERENSFKKMSESVMNALKKENESPDKLINLKNMISLDEINEDHPRVKEIIMSLKEDYSSRLQMEKDKSKKIEYES
jgi:hypothetical protein